MATRYFALIAGIVYVVGGVLGFVPRAVRAPPVGAPDLAVQAGYGYLFGLFPINAIHNAVHLAVGIWGLAAYPNLPASRMFARGLAVIFAVLAVMGIFPVLRTTFGLIPLFGHDIWLHAVTAAVAAYFGFFAPAEAPYAGRERRV